MGNNLQPGAAVLSASGARELFGLTLLFQFLATVAVAARFYAKGLRGRRTTADDWLILAALVYFWGLCAGDFTVVFGAGMGHHEQDLLPAGSVLQKKVYIGIQWAYIVQMTLIRLSICIFLTSVFTTHRFRYIAYGIISISVAWAIFGVFEVAFLCTPFAYNWDKSIQGGHCLDEDTWSAGVAGWDFLLNLCILAMPLAFLHRLEMARSHKNSLIALFAVGVLALAVTITRIATLLDITTADFSSTAIPSLICTTAEPALGILLACAPLQTPLLERHPPSTWFARRPFRRRSRHSAADETSARASWTAGPAWGARGLMDDELDLVPGVAQVTGRAVSVSSGIEGPGPEGFFVAGEDRPDSDVAVLTEVFVIRTVEAPEAKSVEVGPWP